jgi:predicted porin
MQKKIIALAVAGLLSGAAFAQSSVTIYGKADAGFSSASGDVADAQAVSGMTGGRVTGIDSGLWAGSRIGFTGTEDLGGGLKAVFLLEYGLAIDANTGVGTGATTTARQQYVGLTGGFGTFVAGRLQTPGYDWVAKYDPMGGSAFSGVNYLRTGISGDFGAATGGTLHAGSRVNNAAAYISPNLSGFTLKAAYAFGEQDTGVGTNILVVNDSEDRTGVLALAAEYDNGPLSIGGVYHKLSNVDYTVSAAINENKDDQREWGLAASYDFGMVKPFISWQDRSRSFGGANNNNSYDDKIWALGATAPIGAAGTLRLQYARMTGDDQLVGTGAALAANLDNKATAWSLGYTHAMSKRTLAYVGYTHIKLDDGSQTVGANIGGLTALQNESYSRYVAGLNHSF